MEDIMGMDLSRDNFFTDLVACRNDMLLCDGY
jgi:hypothetical protein